MKTVSVLWTAALAAILVFSGTSQAADYSGKKILFVDSYHEGYAWSDGIVQGVQKALENSGADLKIVRMDTKRHSDQAFKEKAALDAKAVIESFRPDVVIAADDNASKYLIEPYFKNAATPFVFCGVNWDAAVYGFPCKNVTGVLETTPVSQLLDQLKPFAKGDRLGFLAPELLTARKEAENIKKKFNLSLVEYYAKDMEDWKKGFLELQGQVDILLIDSDGGLYQAQEKDLIAFVEANTKIPTGTNYDFMAPYALIDFAKSAEEQGVLAAAAALKILGGASPDSIPVVQNKEGTLIVNARIAQKLGLEMPYTLFEAASKVIE